jgi:hypothetical protein
MQFPQFYPDFDFRSSEIGARIDTIYEELGKPFMNPTPGDDTNTGATIDRALEALRLISRLCDEKVASRNYDLFRVVMGGSVPETHTEQKWEAARLSIHGAYKGGKFTPQVQDQGEYTLHILLFLNHHFELAAGQGQDQDEPIRIALHALVYTSNPASITALESFDPADSSFVRGMQYAFQDDRPPDLRKTALLFLPLIRDEWFKTGSLTMDPEQMKRFCADWASTVECVEQTPSVKTAALTVLLEMINSPSWRPHIVAEKLGLLEGLKSVPDDFQPLRSCINNPDLVDAIKGVGHPTAIVHWVTILWLKYGELDPRVRDQLEAVTKEIARNEQGLHFDASKSRVGGWRANTASELGKAKDALKEYPLQSSDPLAVALEEKVEGLQLAVGALDIIGREES